MRAWSHHRRSRLATIVVMCMGYCALMGTDALSTLSQRRPPALITRVWLPLGFSALVAVNFLAVAAFVWLFARTRGAAALLTGFCLCMMATFCVETGAARDVPGLSALGSASCLLALPLLATLVLLFPKNHLGRWPLRKTTRIRWLASTPLRQILLRIYIGLTALLGLLFAPIYGGQYLLHLHLPTWLTLMIFAYCFCVLVGVLASLLISYRRLPTIRQRQQWRIFVGGVLVACLPTLFLTIFPLALGLPRYAVDGQASTLSFALLPVALGYSLLRYQLLLLETAVHRVVSLLLSVVALALLSYLVLIVSSAGLSGQPQALPIVIACCMAIGCPLALWLAKRGTIHLFSDEARHYHRLLAAPHLLAAEKISLQEAVRLLLRAASETLETAEVAIYILTEGRQAFCCCPPYFEDSHEEDPARKAIVEWLSIRMAQDGISIPVGTLPASLGPLLTEGGRPVRLGEVLARRRRADAEEEQRAEDAEVLLAPVSFQGLLMAILVVGRRQEDPRPYSGPDMSVVEALLGRYASVLGTARMLLELQTAYTQQQEIDRLKDQFIMTASHELRTPLTAVQGYLALLTENWETLDEETKRLFLCKAELGCDELATLTDELMNACKVQSNIDQMQIITVNLADEVAHVLDVMASSFQRQERVVTIDLAPTLEVLADRARLRQVLINLLGNALKYSPVGSPVDISGRATPTEACVCIRDYGHGIPPENQQDIFGRMVRLQRDINSPVRGTGLGLFLCKQYLDAMGGHIRVESTGEEGKGSLFLVSLPLSCDGESTRGVTVNFPMHQM